MELERAEASEPRRADPAASADSLQSASGRRKSPAGLLSPDTLHHAHQAVGFVHLHVHSSFSLREGALSIARLSKLALADSMPALAITDTNSLFGALEFSEKLAKEGIQPIIGIQLTVDFGDGASLASRGAETGASRAHLVLLAKDEAGYGNLMQLASRAWLDPPAGDLPHIPIARLADHAGGLIALS